jgi:hypothetical protein
LKNKYSSCFPKNRYILLTRKKWERKKSKEIKKVHVKGKITREEGKEGKKRMYRKERVKGEGKKRMKGKGKNM